MRTRTDELEPGKCGVYASARRSVLSPSLFTHSSRFPPQQEKDVLCYYLFLNPEKLLAPFYPGGLPQEFLWYRYTDFPKVFRKEAFEKEIALIREIMEEMEEPGDFGQEMVCGLVQALMASLYCRFRDRPTLIVKGSFLPVLFPAILHLETEYAAYPDTALLAHLCGLSQRHFLDEFKNSFHQTPCSMSAFCAFSMHAAF